MEGLVVVNAKGIITNTNPGLNEMFGYEEHELINQSLEILLPDAVKASHEKNVNQYFHHPSKRSMGSGISLRGQRKDGVVFPIEVSLNHFVIDGEPMAMGLVSDITIRDNIQQQLKNTNEYLEEQVKERTKHLEESQRLYKAIARNFPNGTISVIDQDFNYIFTEGQQLYKRGITSEHLIGSNYIERLNPKIQKDIEDHLKTVLHGEEVSFEVTLDGGIYLVYAAPLINSHQLVDRVLIVEQNISSQKKAEQDILNSLEKEKELSSMKSQFVSMASHEFRTPLSSILSSSYILKEKFPTEGAIQKHTDRITKKV